ncbi:MAG: T9SS type A sorting domain-containing protein [Flavobacteriaceae bacterium]
MKKKVTLLFSISVLLIMSSYCKANTSKNPNLTYISYTYTSFAGDQIETYLFEGEHVVFLIQQDQITDEQLNDDETMSKIVARFDQYYLFFEGFFGITPPGGMPDYGNKTSIGFISETCGAACGIVGAKGIEVGTGFWLKIFNSYLYDFPEQTDDIIPYEFGRNFFTFGGQALFPYVPNTDERNGGFAEGFANLAYTTEFVSSNVPYVPLYETSAYNKGLLKLFRAYINDLDSDPYNTLHKERLISDLNRNPWGFKLPAYVASGILVGIHETFKDRTDFMPRFFEKMATLPNASSIEEALGNIAYAFSYAANEDLSYFFENTLKFTLDDNSLSAIRALPIEESKLIRDNDVLYYGTIEDVIPLNIRSTRYLEAGEVYQLFIDGELYSESNDGNNMLPYSILGANDVVNATIKLLKNGTVLDSQDITIEERLEINLEGLRNSDDLFFYTPLGLSRAEFLSNGELFLETMGLYEAFPRVHGNYYPIKRGQNLKVTFEADLTKYTGDLIDSNNDDIIDTFFSVSIHTPAASHGTARLGYDVEVVDGYQTIEKTIETDVIFGFVADSIDIIYSKIAFQFVGAGNVKVRSFSIVDESDINQNAILDFAENNIVLSLDDDSTLNDYKIYPNPSSNFIKISGAENIKSITLLDLTGKVLKVIENKNEIGISELPRGIYLLKINSDKGIAIRKVIKQD